MKNLFLFAIILTSACDRIDPEETARNGGSTSEGPPAPPSTDGCACTPGEPDACPLGTDCVPLADGDAYACLAKCVGENEQGGGYVTDCRGDGAPLDCFYPFKTDNYLGDPYCPACLSCSPVNPLSVVCQ